MAQARGPQLHLLIPEFKPENNTITEWLRLVEGPICSLYETDRERVDFTTLKLGKYAHRVKILLDDNTTWEDFKQVCAETCQPSMGQSSALSKMETLTLKADFDDSLEDVTRLTTEAFPNATREELNNHIWRQIYSMTPASIKQLFKMHESDDFRTNIKNLRKLVASQVKSEINMMHPNQYRPPSQRQNFPQANRTPPPPAMQRNFPQNNRTPPPPAMRPRAPLVNPFRYLPCGPGCAVYQMKRDASAQLPVFQPRQQQQRRQFQQRSNIRALEDAPAEEPYEEETPQEEVEEEDVNYVEEEELLYEEPQDF